MGTAVGGLLTIIGAFMPWANLGIISIAGTRGDGGITAGLGVVILAAVAYWLTAGTRETTPRILAALTSVLILMIATYDVTNMQRMIAEAQSKLAGNIFAGLVEPSLGAGLFMTGIGGLVAAVCGVIASFPAHGLPEEESATTSRFRRID